MRGKIADLILSDPTRKKHGFIDGRDGKKTILTSHLYHQKKQ